MFQIEMVLIRLYQVGEDSNLQLFWSFCETIYVIFSIASTSSRSSPQSRPPSSIQDQEFGNQASSCFVVPLTAEPQIVRRHHVCLYFWSDSASHGYSLRLETESLRAHPSFP